MTSLRTRFYRDKKNAKVMGVCSGLEDYTGVNAIWWRLAFIVLTLSTGFGLLIYFALGLLSETKPDNLYVDQDEQRYWQRVRQSPKRTAREIRARLRDIDHRLADIESYYVSNNQRLSAEIEKLR